MAAGLLPALLPVGPLRRRLVALCNTLRLDLSCLRTARPVLYTHRGQDVVRLTPKPKVVLVSARRVGCSMKPSFIAETLLAAERGEPVVLTRHGVVVALLTPVLEVFGA